MLVRTHEPLDALTHRASEGRGHDARDVLADARGTCDAGVARWAWLGCGWSTGLTFERYGSSPSSELYRLAPVEKKEEGDFFRMFFDGKVTEFTLLRKQVELEEPCLCWLALVTQVLVAR